METPLISIVMPAYNVEPYIARAVECVRAQTYRNWELIIVDDAATDGTIDAAMKSAQGDERVRIVRHEENKGLSAARNTGMTDARGTYLWFCDPDDTYDPDLLETCMRAEEEAPADVVVFGVCEEYFGADDGFLYSNTVLPEAATYRTSHELRPHVLELEQNTCLGYAWNKLYRMDYLNTIHASFQTVPLIEDIVFNVAVFQSLDSLDVIAAAPYHYARRIHTNLTSGYLEHYGELMHRRIRILRHQQASWGLLNDDSKAVLGALLARYVLSEAERNCAPGAHMNHKARVEWCNRVFGDPLYRELIPHARANSSKALRFCLKPLQAGSVRGTLALGRLIHIARTHFLPLFTKVKSGR